MRRLPAALVPLLALGCGHDRAASRASALPSLTVSVTPSTTSSTTPSPPAGGPSSAASATSPSREPASTGPAGTPAAPGTYAIAVDGSESFGGTTRTYPATSTLDVSGTGAVRTVVVRFSEDRDDTDTVDLSGGGIRLRKSDARIRVLAYTRHTVLAPSPPLPLLPANARVGERFGGSYSGEMHGTYYGTVEHRERVTVGGVAVDALVVLETVRYSGDADGTTTTRTWWDPARRLPVKQRVDSTATSGGQSYEQHVTITLQRLSPS